MTTNRSPDTEIIDFQSIIISAIILQISFAKDVHNLPNAKLCPIYSPINKSSRNIYKYFVSFNKFKFSPKLQFKSTRMQLQLGYHQPINIRSQSTIKSNGFNN